MALYRPIIRHNMRKILITILILIFWFTSNGQTTLRINKFLVDSFTNSAYRLWHDSTHAGNWGVVGSGGGGGGSVNSVTGTANRIVITGTATDPIVNISTSYVGQNTITTLGTITTGVWNGTTIAVANGGTGATTPSGARTNLGATTVGSNIFTSTNPSAITFLRANADNTVDWLSASDFRTAIGAGTGSGTVTSVSFTGGLISVGTPTTTPAFTVAGTSGGIPYFSSTSTWATSSLLAANAIMIGGGAGTAPSTTTTGTGILTALSNNIGSAGAPVTFNGALGTPSSGTVTNLTGTASININGTVGATTPTTGAFTTVTASTSATTPIIYGSSSASGTLTLNSTSNGTKGSIIMADSVNFSNKTIENYSAKYNNQTGTSYTLVATDNGKILTFDNGSDITLTVPAGLPTGFTCTVVQLGAGEVVFTASSTTLHNRSSFTKTGGQYAVAAITMYATDVFIFGGDCQ